GPSNGLPWQVVGIRVADSTGTVTNNRVDLFRPSNTGVGPSAAFLIQGPRASLSLSADQATLSAPGGDSYGVRIESVSSAAALIERVKLVAGSSCASEGLIVDGSQLELYSSFASTGSSSNSSASNSEYPAAVNAFNASSVYAVGNTFEVGSDPTETGTSAALA